MLLQSPLLPSNDLLFYLMASLTSWYQAVPGTKLTIPQGGLQLKVILTLTYKHITSLISCLSVRCQTLKAIKVSRH